jgi:AAA domain
MPFYVCALPNKKGAGIPQEFISDDIAKIEEWARQHDKPGWGVYDCINPLKGGATARNKDNVAAVVSIRIDIDPKSVIETVDEVDAHLGNMLLPPSALIDSGRGRHADWALKEPISTDDAEMIARVDTVRSRLIETLCGDPAPSHHAALFRRPGTHNTKEGAWLECRFVHNGGAPVDLTELEDMVALYDRPLLSPKAGEGENVSYVDFTAGSKTAVDVEAALAAMRYQGGNNTGINATWWRCMGSLLRHGSSVADTIDQLHAAAAANCQDDPAKADWHKTLAGMAERWLRHEPEFLVRLDSKLYSAWTAAVADGKQPRLIWRQDLGLQVRGYGQVAAAPVGAAVTGGTTGATVTPLSRPQPSIAAKPFQRFDPAKIPAREWLYGGHYQRGIITATVGPGGGGKSSLDLVELIAMCTGRDLLGEQPLLRCKAWYHNAEDSNEEIYRRIAAICQHYGIDQSELEGWLFITSGIEMPIRITAARNGKATIDAAATEAIIRTIADNEIGVASFDPLIAHHSSIENATEDMDQVVREFARIANATECSIEIVHHTRKPAPGQEELSVIDSRGAGAIVNAVRSARVLNTMSKTEAEKAGIDEIDRRLYFRVDNGKANMVPPSTARWRKFASIDLPNGDNVGVVTAWAFPTAAATDLPDTLCAQLQIRVAQDEYKVGPQSPDWIGHLVADTFGLDADTKAGRAAVGRYLSVLYRKGVIAIAKGETGRHPVKIVVPGTWRPQPAAGQCNPQ